MTFEHALYKAATAIITNNQPEALAICNGVVPDYDEFVRPPAEQDTSARSVAFASSLAANAGRISTVLTAMGTPDTTAAPVRQLGLAHSEGLTVEWAVGLSIEVIDQSMLMPGIDRLITPEDWEPVYGYLTHLQATAPAAAFTEEVRSTLLGDMYTAILTPREQNWLGELHPNHDTYAAMLSGIIERIIAIMPRE